MDKAGDIRFGNIELDPDHVPHDGESLEDFYARSAPRWEASRKALEAVQAERAARASGALPERRGTIGREERRARALYSGDAIDQFRAYLEGVPGAWGLVLFVSGLIWVGMYVVWFIVVIFLMGFLGMLVRDGLRVIGAL